ncbi:MAG: hypothetical protein AAF927_02540 [Bacteroidota bacterium]
MNRIITNSQHELWVSDQASAWRWPTTLVWLVLFALFFTACDTGSPLDNLPPDTKIFVDQIDLSGPNRLNSVVRLRWSGEDQDGYVKGYELSFDEQNWDFVQETDSTFRFDIPVGSDTTDISFYVRAIDDDDTADPSPAFLSVPIRNTPPTVKFDSLTSIPDTVLSVWSILWRAEDLDGNETLDSLFIRLNDGAWYPIDRFTTFASFIPESPMQAGSQNAQLYLDAEADLQDNPLQDLRVDGDNQLFIQARDIAGSLSPIDSSEVFFVKRQTADLLVVDAHGSALADGIYRSSLLNLSLAYDYYPITTQLPPFWDPTIGFLLGLYDKVFWYSDGEQLSGLGERIAMEVGSTQIQEYLNQGGKILFTAKFPNPFPNADAPNQSTIFGFSPMDSLSTSSGQARLPKDSLAVPQGDFANRFPVLESSTFITGADPFYSKDPINDIYVGQIAKVNNWVGPSTIAARTVFSNGKTNQVFFSIELHKLNQNGRVTDCIDVILNQEFDW